MCRLTWTNSQKMHIRFDMDQLVMTERGNTEPSRYIQAQPERTDMMRLR